MKHSVISEAVNPEINKSLFFRLKSSYIDVPEDNSCKPSMLKLYQREKLERICLNKINHGSNIKTHLEYDYVKNDKTGEYQIHSEVICNIKINKIQEIINKLEQSILNSTVNRNIIQGPEEKPKHFNEIISKFSCIN